MSNFVRASHRAQSVALAAVLAASLACGSIPTALSPTAGVTGGPTPTSAAVTSPTTPQPTAITATTPDAPAGGAFAAVVDNLGPQGEVSPEMALQAFALAVAPLPGVTPPAGEPGQLDADLALAWVAQVWEQLLPAQQAAITAALAPMSDPYATRGAGARGRLAAPAEVPDCGVFQADPADTPSGLPVYVQPYAEMVKAAYGAIASHLGRQTMTRLAVCVLPSGAVGANALARPFDAQHQQVGLPVACAIFLNADTLGAMQDSGHLGFVIAAETFTCFQYTADPTETLAALAARGMPTWVRSGTLAWAGATVAGELFGDVGDTLAEPWAGYLTEPQRGLFQRGPSAVGFFAQLEQATPGVWSVLDQTLTAPDSLAAFTAATSSRPDIADLWAAGYFRDSARGPDWDMRGPGITQDTAEPTALEVGNGDSATLAAPALAVALGELTANADITVLSGEHLRVHDGVQDLKDVRQQPYCTKPGGASACACPADTPGAGLPPPPPLNPEAKLALTGLEAGATATIQGLSLEAYCGRPPTAQPGGGAWSLVFWSPELGDDYPPLLVAYTCAGLESTWQAVYLPGTADSERDFDLPFGEQLVVHRDFHYDIPPDGLSSAITLDYAIDFTLAPSATPPVLIVTGLKTETQDGRSFTFSPREFGAESLLVIQNVSLETQLKPYPKYQHPVRTQALAECGG